MVGWCYWISGSCCRTNLRLGLAERLKSFLTLFSWVSLRRSGVLQWVVPGLTVASVGETWRWCCYSSHVYGVWCRCLAPGDCLLQDRSLKFGSIWKDSTNLPINPSRSTHYSNFHYDIWWWFLCVWNFMLACLVWWGLKFLVYRSWNFSSFLQSWIVEFSCKAQL